MGDAMKKIEKRVFWLVLFVMVSPIALAFGAASCTEQGRAKNWGGTMTETLPAGQKLINATWKGEDLWLLTRPARAGESPETYTFKGHGSIGILNGTVIIVEK
jgi:hypothetical protein